MTTINNLPPLETLSKDLIFPAVDNSTSPGTTVKVSLDQLVALSAGPRGYPGVPGPQGPSGPRGAAGIDSTVSGFSGYSGNAGNNGSSGYSGQNGVSGASGYSGKNGPTGSSGTSGFSGVIGLSGVSGFSGYSGRSGRAGPVGLAGQSGNSGFSGFSGYSGRSGFPGASGFSGVKGVSGLAGQSGTSGISGYSGNSGYSGAKGLPGATGNSGFSGVPGPSGPQGEQGTSGYSGYSGIPGPQGVANIGDITFNGVEIYGLNNSLVLKANPADTTYGIEVYNSIDNDTHIRPVDRAQGIAVGFGYGSGGSHVRVEGSNGQYGTPGSGDRVAIVASDGTSTSEWIFSNTGTIFLPDQSEITTAGIPRMGVFDGAQTVALDTNMNGKFIFFNNNTAAQSSTILIPANADNPLPIGFTLSVVIGDFSSMPVQVNAAGNPDVSILASGNSTLGAGYWEFGGSAAPGLYSILKIDTNTWLLDGPLVSVVS